MSPSAIEWTDETWNPTVGCSRVSPGCDGCYAIGVAHRAMQPAHTGLTVRTTIAGDDGFETFGPVDWTGEVRCLPDRLYVPLRWRRPRRVFVDSMSDLFEPQVLKFDDGEPAPFLARVFATMVQAQQHTFQVLTKRTPVMRAVMNEPMFRLDVNAELLRRGVSVMPGGMTDPSFRWPSNIWLGTSAENQRYADLRIPHLLATPAAVRFLSIEPLLGPVDLGTHLHPRSHLTDGRWHDDCRACQSRRVHGGTGTVDWVIVGGESGAGARPMHPDWVRSIRDQCAAAGVAFLFKQWGEWSTTEQCGVRNGLLSRSRFEFRSRRFAPDGTDYQASGGPSDPRAPGGYAAPGMESMIRVGKKRAGRELDGRTWDDFPA